MPKLPKKLIEVALPLDDINKAAAREKSIRHGHPSTLHLWWARRPLAAARAVLFAQLVNDPGSTYEGDKRTKAAKAAIHAERERLFVIIRDLVQWENSTNEEVLEKARAEIRKSWAYTCTITGDDPEKMPPVLDPFCGGGTIPLEAQRLGLEAHGSDLNPVPVLISKALVEIPPKFADQPPVGPTSDNGPKTVERPWKGAEGLAEDIRRYGQWMREEAFKRIGHLYPAVDLPEETGGGTATVIAWIWARTVRSPNPAYSNNHVPLVSNHFLSRKKGREVWLQPIANGNEWRYEIRHGSPTDMDEVSAGTRAEGRGSFRCLLSGATMSTKYIRQEAQAGRMGQELIAIACTRGRGRIYVQPDAKQMKGLGLAKPDWRPAGETPSRLTGGTCHGYGLSSYGDLFTDRQLVALTTFCDLIDEVRTLCDTSRPNADYGNAVAHLLAFAISRSADRGSTLCTWDSSPKMEALRNTFGRQALPMTWDFAEGNPFSDSSGCWSNNVEWTAKVIEKMTPAATGNIALANAEHAPALMHAPVISTDPPYYDNIAYADLSDFFYLWLRRSLRHQYPDLFHTLMVPKDKELVAAAYRHGSAEKAHTFFMDGMTSVIRNLCKKGNKTEPATIYYAFKQSETKNEETMSSGWESFLQAVSNSGYQITATWPMRTELSNRMVGSGTNALASSIVLACRPRPENADEITRRQFQRELSKQLPDDLEEMIHGTEGVSPIAPVDLAQAAIGPGMAIFSQYKAVLEADGSPMSVHNALIMINKAIDEYFDAAEGSMDGLTRFCAQWVQQYGFKAGPYGEADGICRACGVSTETHPEAIESGKGKVRLRPAKEYDLEALPTLNQTSIWVCLHAIAARLEKGGAASAGTYLAANPGAGPDIRSLAYRLYTICERAKLTDHARTYNNVVTSWDAIVEASRQAGLSGEQQTLFEG